MKNRIIAALLVMMLLIPTSACATDFFSNMEEWTSALEDAVSEQNKPTATPKPMVTPKPISYPELKRGSEGNAVKLLQEHLIYYDYLAEGEADGVYGAKTALAVHLFKQANGIFDPAHAAGHCVATSEMQQKMYSNGVVDYSEPEVTLEIMNGAYMNWENVSGDRLKIRIEVTNTSVYRTIKAFELSSYTADVWGTVLLGDRFDYTWTTEKTVTPGSTVKSDYYTIEYRSQIDKIYVAVSKVVYSDGTVAYNDPYDLNYSYWTYQD